MVNKIELRKYATEQIASGKMSAQEAEDYMTRNGAPLQADYLQRVAKPPVHCCICAPGLLGDEYNACLWSCCVRGHLYFVLYALF